MASVTSLIKHSLIAAIVVAATYPVSAKALPDKDYWRWFEVEVLVFKQRIADQSSEQFQLSPTRIDARKKRDLLTSFLINKPRALISGLPICEPLDDTQLIDLACRYENEEQWIPIAGNPLAPPAPLMALPETPVVIDGKGGDINTAAAPFLVPAEKLELNEIRTELLKKGQATPLLHLAWRQPVFKKGVGPKYRLFAGTNYSNDFFYDGFPKQDEEFVAPLRNPNVNNVRTDIEQLFNLIESGQQPFKPVSKLPQPEQTPSLNRKHPLVWEFDGLIDIYLIGNYLHIDGEFNLREMDSLKRIGNSIEEQATLALAGAQTDTEFLRSYYFSQLRRVISHETHYFDHPKLGVVVQIRRTDLSAPRY
ncbi:hypothetical protein CEW91_05115 [Idiomarina piscisalsi]|uniref:Peptidoglycan-binding protein CsiV n=1 Tax=Idiomarina piscisalsi TaxID=1096243 RepID=A0ABN5APF7_9GAMM|nr:CsiV family protein [Idiomarina piscisalsi]ASG65549.1 hypothetical protein CEW91_05115 [Idiomarina piscisalsi]